MTRFSTLSLVFALIAFALLTISSSAQNGVPAEGNTSDTFIDENADGICDTYQAVGAGKQKTQKNTQRTGQENSQSGKTVGRGNGADDGSQAKNQVRLRDNTKTGTFGPEPSEGVDTQKRRGGNSVGNGKGRGRK